MRDRIGYLNPYNIDACNDCNWWINPDTPEFVLPITKEAIRDYLQAHGVPSFGLKVKIRNRQSIYTQDKIVDLVCDRLRSYATDLFLYARAYKSLNKQIEMFVIWDVLRGNEHWLEASVEWLQDHSSVHVEHSNIKLPLIKRIYNKICVWVNKLLKNKLMAC